MMNEIVSSWFCGVAFSEALLPLVEPIKFRRKPFQLILRIILSEIFEKIWSRVIPFKNDQFFRDHHRKFLFFNRVLFIALENISQIFSNIRWAGSEIERLKVSRFLYFRMDVFSLEII